MTAATPTPQQPILEAIGLRKTFSVSGGRWGTRQTLHAVEPISLSLTPGQALALVGESGSGKTTVARLLARLYAPTRGRSSSRASRSSSWVDSAAAPTPVTSS